MKKQSKIILIIAAFITITSLIVFCNVAMADDVQKNANIFTDVAPQTETITPTSLTIKKPITTRPVLKLTGQSICRPEETVVDYSSSGFCLGDKCEFTLEFKNNIIPNTLKVYYEDKTHKCTLSYQISDTKIYTVKNYIGEISISSEFVQQSQANERMDINKTPNSKFDGYEFWALATNYFLL